MATGYVLNANSVAPLVPLATRGTVNIHIKADTTTNANDSITITGDSAALSSTNPGFVTMESGTSGQSVIFQVTADVTIDLTGAHWGAGTTGDLTDAILRVLALNDNGTLRWGVAYQGGRDTVVTTDTNATPTNITTPEGILCDTAVGSATNTAQEIGYFKANFDDTAGAAEDLWAVQTGVGDIVVGKSADGIWQPWNPVFGGFSSDPTVTTATWTQIGQIIYLIFQRGSLGTSNATSFTVTAPIKARAQDLMGPLMRPTDNSAAVTSVTRLDTAANSQTLTLYTTPAGNTWTAANNKGADFVINYRMAL